MSASDAYGIVTVLVTKATALQTALDPTTIFTGPVAGTTGLNASELDKNSATTGYSVNDAISADVQTAIDAVTEASSKILSVTKF